MSNSFFRKIKKKKSEEEQYSYISTEDLEKLKNRGLELSNKIKSTDFVNNPKEFKEYSLELHKIITDLKKYKKYAKN